VRIWSYAKPYGWLILGSLITILLITGIGLLAPQLFRIMIDDAIPNNNPQLITLLALGMVAIPLVNGVIGVYQRRLNATIGEGLIYDLRIDLYQHMQAMSLRFFTQTRTGELMSRLNNDVQGAQTAISDTTVDIATNIIRVVATLAIMAAMDWRLTLLAVLVLPLFMLPARHFARILRDLRRRAMEYNAEMNASMNETLNVSGALLVKLFGQEKREVDVFSSQARAVHDIGIDTAVVGRWFMMMLTVVTAVGIGVVYLFGGHLVLAGALSIGTIVAFGAYLGQLYGPMQTLTNAPVAFAQSMVSFERVFEVMDLPVEIKEVANPVDLGHAQGRIAFDDVSFDYEALQRSGEVASLESIARYGWRVDSTVLLKRGKQTAEEEVEQAPDQIGPRIPERQWAVENVSFVIEPGQLAALVGPSGAGKSTITYLIPRLYDPTLGRVCVDDIDIKEATLESLASNIGMVTQETYLFYNTIRANLLYANPEASEEQMVEAARAANIHDLIVSLPDGYDTVVGERGYRLSGGERQRVAIARVILMDPQILVLDEATSALDSISEALVQDALQRVMAGRTSLVIAHRLSTILSADVILVMRDGRLAEQGTHQELLAQGGLYKELYETQFKTAVESFQMGSSQETAPVS
jgi:ATP-binding cassette, subfamily B, bacterial